MRTSAATAIWKGDLPKGEGTFRADSGAFEGDYTFATRFRDAAGTNPEELLSAAHAACFSMALANGLAKAGHPADLVETRAAATLDETEGGFAVTRIRLTVRGRVHGIDSDTFLRAAEEAKNGCPISRTLRETVQIELEAELEG